MAKEIDEKVVEMRFDNQNFEKNVSQSMSTLERLKASLKMDGAAKSFSQIDSAAKKVNLSGIGAATDALKLKFSALEVVSVTALANIANSAVNAGKRLLNSLTIAPIGQGFSEYELKMGSIQTMMMSTGESLETVNKYLDELNTYADKTIYSFSDMTSNIGKFTNAGVGLKDAVKAIQGVSNVAAVSGANANQASQAMYNFAQALSSGAVKLIDWKSIENANMATVEFKNELIKTAVAMGTLVESEGRYVSTTTDANGHVSDAFTATSLFNDSLSSQWMTTEVLVDTLGRYSDETTEIGKKAFSAAQDVKTFTQLMDTLKESVGSGWAQTWEIIFGDFEEAKNLWSGISDVVGGFIDRMSDARNNLLKAALSSEDSAWGSITKMLSDSGIALDDFQNVLTATAKKHSIAVDEIVKSEGSLDKAMSSGKISNTIVVEALRAFADSADSTAASVTNVTEKVNDLKDVVNRVIIGDFGNGAERMQALTDAGYDYATVQELVNKTLNGEAVEFDNLSDAQMKSIGYTEEQIATIRKLADEAEKTGTPLNNLLESMSKPSGRTLIIESFSNALKGFGKILKSIGDAWNDVIPPMTAERLYSIIEHIHSFSERLIVSDKTAADLRNTFKGLFSIVDLLGQAFFSLFEFASPISGILGKMGSKILGVTGAFGEWLSGIDKSARETSVFGKAVQGIIDFLTKLKDTAFRTGKELKEGLDLSWIDDVKNRIRKFVQGIKETFNLPGFDEIGDFFANLGDNLGKGLDDFSADGFIKSFNNAVKAIQDGKVNFDFLRESLKKFKDGIGTKLSEIGTQFKSLGDGLSVFKDNALTKAGSGFSGMMNSILDAMIRAKEFLTEHIDIGALATVGFGGAFIFLMKKLSDAIGFIAEPFKNVSDLIGSVGGVFSSISKLIKSFEKTVKAERFKKYTEGIRNIAISIAILAGSMIALANIDTDKLISGGIALAALGTGLTLMSIAMSKFSSSTQKISKDGFTKTGGSGSMLAFVVSIKILLSAMKDIQKMDPLSFVASFGGLVVLGAAFVGAMVAIQKVSDATSKAAEGSKKGTNALFSMLAFAFSLKTLVKSLKDLTKLGPKKVSSALPIMASLVGMMASMMIVAGRSKVDTKSGAGVLAMGASILLMVNAIKMITKIDTADLAKGLIVTALLATVVNGMAKSLSRKRNSSGDTAKVGVGVLAMSGAFVLMAEVVKILGQMDASVLAKGLAVSLGIGAIFTALIAVTKLAGDNAAKAGVSMLAMSGAIIVLSGAIFMLGNMDGEVLSKGLTAITVIGTIFAGLIAVTKLAGNAAKTIAVIAGSVAALSVVVGLMSMIDPNRLFNATAAISSIMGMMALVIASTKLAKSAEKSIITISIVVAGLGGSIYALSALPAQSVLASAGALSMLMLSLSSSMLIVSKAGNVSMQAIGALALLELAVAGVAVILGVMGALNVNPSIETAASLSLMLVSLAGVTAILAAIGPIASGAIQGALMFDAVVAIIGALMVGIGALVEYVPQVESFLDTGIDVLNKIATGIGEFFGNIISGFAQGVMSGLPAIGASLSAFMVNATPFFMGAKAIDSDIVEKIGGLVGAILLLTGAEFLTGLTSFANTITGGAVTDSFGQLLGGLARAVTEYSESLGDINVGKIEASQTAVDAIMKISNALPRSGGVVGFLFGEKQSLEGFGDNLTAFGTALVNYSNAVSADGAINVKAIQDSARAAEAMSKLEGGLTSDSGLIGFFLGGNRDLGDFGSSLENFGKGLAAYSAAVSAGDFHIENIEASVEAVKAMAGIESDLSADKGLLGMVIGGNQSFDTFGKNLQKLGEGLTAYSNSLTGEGGVDLDAIQGSIEALSALSGIEAGLSQDSGVWGWLAGGNQGLDSFGNNLKKLGAGLAGYSSSITENGGINTGAITTSIEAVKKIAQIAVDLSGIDTQAFSDVSWGLGGFGGAIQTFCSNISAVDVSSVPDVSGIINGVVAMVDMVSSVDTGKLISFGDTLSALGSMDAASFMQSFKELGSEGVNGFVQAFSEASTQANEAGVTLVKNVVAGIESSYPGMNAAGEVLVQNVATGAANTVPQASNDLSNALGSGFGQVLSDASSMFNQGGLDMGLSIGDGLSSALPGIETTVEGVSDNALNAFKGMSPQFNEAGQINASEYMGGLQSGSYDLSSIASEMGTENYNELLANSDLFNEAGELNMESLTQGYQSGSKGTTEYLEGYMNSDISSVLSQSSESFKTGASENMDAYNSAIQAKKDEAVAAINVVLSAVQEAIVGANSNFSEGASGNISAFLSSFQIGDIDDGGAGQSLMSSFVSAIGSPQNTADATSAFDGMIVAILAVAKDSEGKFFSAGVTFVVQMISGMQSKTGDANAAGVSVASNALSGMRSLSFYSAGTNAGQGFINGINVMLGPAYSAGWNLGRSALLGAYAALDSHSPSREFIYLGENVGKGYVIGVNNWIAPTAKATSAMMEQSIATAKKGIDTFEDWLDERKYYSEISVKEELAGWEQLQKQYEVGSEERKKIDREVYRCQNELVEATYQFSVDWIEKEKYYKRLSLEDELAAWKRVQSRYMAGSEERTKADREIFRVQNELEDERYQKKLDHIDNEVFYGRMSLREELAALEELQKQYEVNSEKWSELDKKIYSKRKEVVSDFYSKLNDYISNEKTFMRMGDVGELGTIMRYINQFEEGTDEWKKGMTSAFNLVISIGEAHIQYEKDIAAAEAEHAEKRLQMEEEYAEKVKSINQQLEDDIDDLNKKYEDAVKSRADSLYKSYGLFDEVSKKDEVSGDTLIKNLKGQVAEFDEWQSTLQSLKSKGVSGELIEELQEMGPSAIANVRAINGMSATELTQYVNLWSTKHRQAREQATGELEGMRADTQNKIAQLKVDAAKELDDYKATWQKKMNELDASLQKDLENITTDFHKSIGYISKYTEEEFKKMAENVGQIMSAKGYNIGTNLILGILKGYEENKPELLRATDGLATGAISEYNNAAGINSPSKVMYQSGLYTVMGLLNAFRDMKPKLLSAGEDTAESAKNGFVVILDTIGNLVDSDFEYQPTIRPVVDLSDAYAGAYELDGMFAADRSLALANQVTSNNAKSKSFNVTVDNRDVVSAIGELRSDVAAMAESIGQMQVVLDNGSLVGAMAAPMDAALGRRQIYRGRGN